MIPKHRLQWENVKPAISPQKECESLRERFHKVILGAGYSESAAQSILTEHFDAYMQKLDQFIKMLEKYERQVFDPLD